MARFKQKYMGGKDGSFLSFNINENNLSNEVIFTPSALTPEETDPVFLASPAANITSTDIANWNNKLEQFIITFTDASAEAWTNGYGDDYQYFTCDKTISEIAAANQKGYKIVVNGINSQYWNPENSNIITNVYEDDEEFACTIYYQHESSQKIYTTELYIESGEDYWTYEIESDISDNPFRLIELKWSSYHETISTETWNEIYRLMSSSTGYHNIILYESKNESPNTYYNYWYFESRHRISGSSPTDTLWFRQNHATLKLELYNQTVEITEYFPDWNENSSDNLSFIKNRTHYMEIEDNYEWLDNEEFSFTGTTAAIYFNASDAEQFEDWSKANGFIENELYTITLNETTYNLQCYTDNDKKGYFIGNSTLLPTTFTFSENHNTEIPFAIFISDIITSYYNKIIFYRDINIILNNVTQTLTITGPRKKYNSLDSNYLNGQLIKYGTGQNAEVFNNSKNIASGSYSHAEGNLTTASGSYSHTEGLQTTASGSYSHAEGNFTTASGISSHVEGYVKIYGLKLIGSANTLTYQVTSNTDIPPRLIDTTNISDRIRIIGTSYADIIITAVTTDENERLNSITLSETLSSTSAINGNYRLRFHNIAKGTASHTEGECSLTKGEGSHAGGILSEANGKASFAHGQGVIANADNQNVFGKYNIVDSTSAFIVGNGNSSTYSNAYTLDWNGNGVYAGKLTVGAAATNNMDVPTLQQTNGLISTAAAGIPTNWINGTASGSIRSSSSKAENSTYSLGKYAITEGYQTQASGNGAHAEGYYTEASGQYSHAEGYSTGASNSYSHAEGQQSIASGGASHAEGYSGMASGSYSHAEGHIAKASGYSSHAEGSDTIASGDGSHAEGQKSMATGLYSHAEGNIVRTTIRLTGAANATTYTVSDGPVLRKNTNPNRLEVDDSYIATAFTIDSNSKINSITFAETLDADNAVNKSSQLLIKTIATGESSHAEGKGALSSGTASHAGGYLTVAANSYSFAHGENLVTSRSSQAVFGQFNVEDSSAAFIVGNGSSSTFSNAYTLDWSGNGIYAGKLTVGAGPTNNMDVATKQYVDNATVITNTLESGILIATINGVNIYAPSYTNGDNLGYGGNE